MAKEIPLSQGKVAIVDDEDFCRIAAIKWHAHRMGRKGQVWRAERGIKRHEKIRKYMHHEVMMSDEMIDHIDGNPLNNQKSNLRVCNIIENNRNRKCSSIYGYKGVGKSGKKWRARIKISGVLIDLGVYEKITDAARAYDKKARALFGEFARCNFDCFSETELQE